MTRRRCDLCHEPIGFGPTVSTERWIVHLECAWSVRASRPVLSDAADGVTLTRDRAP